jgi:ABC-2 type transport system permease protein
MLIWMLTTTMPLVSLVLWSAVAEGAPVGRFGAREFTAYFLVTLIVRQLTSSWLVWEMNADIKSGALSQRLLKPLHPLFVYSAENLAALPLRVVLCVPIAVAALLAAGQRLPGSPGALAFIAVALLGAWLLNFLIMALIGALAFVMESSISVFEVYFATFMIFSGYLVPLELFPPALRELAAVLPFRYTLAFPVEVATGLLAPGRWAIELAIQWAYVAGVGCAALLAWRAGLRRFGAFGG